MLGFGFIVIASFTHLLRGQQVSLRPVQVIGVVYVGFGLSAMIASDLDPFFVLFLAPGLLLLVAAWPPRRGGSGSGSGAK